MNRWLNDTNVLANLRIDWTDQLEVIDDCLHLNQGQHFRSMGRSVTSDPSVVGKYLESLITKVGQECFQHLQGLKDDTPAYYEKVADFKRQVNYLRRGVIDLGKTFESHDCNNKSHLEQYSRLFKLATEFWAEVKKYKATLKKPSLQERPVKQIQYNERTDFRLIKSHRYPKRVPIEETVKAAKQALLLAQTKQDLRSRCFKVISQKPILAIPTLILGFLTVFKIVLWNPLERLICGEVRTISPISRFLPESVETKRHMQAYQLFSTQLLHQPFITDEVVKAFKELAPQANRLDLGTALLASDDITEFAPFIEEYEKIGAIPVDKYLSTMKRLCKEKNIKLQTLHRVTELYRSDNSVFTSPYQQKGQSIDDFLSERADGMAKEADEFKAQAALPYVSPGALQELLNAASSSPTCRDIVLSTSHLASQSVRDFLSSHSYESRTAHGLNFRADTLHILIYRRH